MSGLSTQRHQGFALISVIWVLVLMTYLALSFTKVMRRESDLGRASLQSFQRQAFGTAGINRAKQMLTDSDRDRWIADGRLYHFQFHEAEIRVQLFSEQGKINLNAVDERLLDKMLLPVTGADERQALVDAILDWRDPDEYVRLSGAEAKQYLQAGLLYKPANQLFTSVQQFQWVIGMTDTVYQYLRPLVTVWSSDQQVNRSLASVAVLNCLDGQNSHSYEEVFHSRRQSAYEVGEEIAVTGGNFETQYYTLVAQAKVKDQLSQGIEELVKIEKTGPNTWAISTVMWQETDHSASLFSAELDPAVVLFPL